MPRSLRPLVADGTYHVTSRGNDGTDVFRDVTDRLRFLGLLDTVTSRLGWRVQSYCLMTNHVHLLVRTPCPDLDVGMRVLLGDHAQRFNVRHGRRGHLFSDRYHSVLVQRQAHLLEIPRYLALNPVRAGMCSAPEHFAWSAHAALVGAVTPPRFLATDETLAIYGGRSGYAAFVDDLAGSSDLLTGLVAAGTDEALDTARRAGFTQAQIAEAVGRSQRWVSSRLACYRGSDPR